MPVVGAKEPCPCGSGKKYKACHGRAADDRRLTSRPFEGLPGEVEWVALREIVPAATARLTLRQDAGREVLLATLLPLAWPGLVRSDGRAMLGLQVPTRSGDVSRDLAWALEQTLRTEPGNPVQLTGLPGPGPRLQDLLADVPLEVTLHQGFDFWVEGADPDGEVAASLERANATAVPTARVGDEPGAYWCRMRERSHLRWVLPHAEEPALDALARLASEEQGLALGEGTRYVGSFRAHGLLVPVWDLPLEREADALVDPVTALRGRLDEALAAPRELTAPERRTRAGLLNRQVTLR